MKSGCTDAWKVYPQWMQDVGMAVGPEHRRLIAIRRSEEYKYVTFATAILSAGGYNSLERGSRRRISARTASKTPARHWSAVWIERSVRHMQPFPRLSVKASAAAAGSFSIFPSFFLRASFTSASIPAVATARRGRTGIAAEKERGRFHAGCNPLLTGAGRGLAARRRQPQNTCFFWGTAAPYFI